MKNVFKWKRTSEKELELPDLETGMRLEVVTPENKLIFVGRIESVKRDAIQVTDVTGEDVPYIPYNSPVKLRGFHHSRAIFMGGQIGGSSRKFWRIDRLQTLQISEQRSYFRQNISREAKVMCINELFGEQKSEDERKKALMSCHVTNISATGAMIRTREDFQEGDWLRLMDLVLVPGENAFALTCVVRRSVEDEQGRGYGCEFYELDSKEQERLIKSILVLQRKERQERQKERE